jgi:simple sugar transport system ATP-binding protein
VSGIVPELSVRENIILALQARRNVFAPLSVQKQREVAEKMVAALRISTTDIDKPIQFLSGGNQQKCLLARWLVTEPKLLLLDEPTRGIDIGAKQEILDLINDLREKGMALVIADSELAELLRVATEIAVLRDRKFVLSDQASNLKEEAIMALMAEGGA